MIGVVVKTILLTISLKLSEYIINKPVTMLAVAFPCCPKDRDLDPASTNGVWNALALLNPRNPGR